MAAETDAQAAAVANTSGITPDTLRAMLEVKLSAEKVFVEDVSGKIGWLDAKSYTYRSYGCTRQPAGS